MSRNHDLKRDPEGLAELESQFILRMPEEPSKVLRELLRTGANLKDRCTIRLENDMRYGEVRVDHWLMHAKIVDLPTIVESMKTIDNKSFYKTADICQMMICKEEADQPSTEEESPNKNKKKDPFKVEKKFLWPHGITPPAKNVRKRRFRKTLKKKYVEAPEIEKEVKRLLRVDNDAVSVKWEVLSEEEDASSKSDLPGGSDHKEVSIKKEKTSRVKQEPRTPKRDQNTVHSEPSNNDTTNADVEHDIFGGAVSDSDEEIRSNINVEMDDNSRLSEYDSRLTDSNSFQGQSSDMKGNFPTQFQSDMFSNKGHKWSGGSAPSTPTLQSASHSRAATPGSQSIFSRNTAMSSPTQDDFQDQTLNKEGIQMRMEQITIELESLRSQRVRKEQEVAGMENLALRQRFQDILQNLIQDIIDKEMEYQDFQVMLQQMD